MASDFSIDVNPAVLRWARIAAGQKLVDVAKRLSIPEQTIVQWESGGKAPAWQSLRKLAQCYQRPLAALLLPEPPRELENPPDFRSLPAARRELSSSSLLAIRTSRWLQGRAIEMRRELGIEPQFKRSAINTAQDPAKIAASARRLLGVDLAEQTNWRNSHEAYRQWKTALADLGILVFQFRFPRDEIQGFSFFDQSSPAIIVNEEDVVEARVFTLFHEYAHLLLKQPGMCIPQAVVNPLGASIEPFCNRFAASLLVPESEVQSWNVSLGRSKTANDHALRQLARRYRVSKDVVLMRLRTANRITEEEFARIYTRWKRERTQTATLASPPTKPRAGGQSRLKKATYQRGTPFIDLVLQAAKRDVITTHDALNYLGIKLNDFNKLASRQ